MKHSSVALPLVMAVLVASLSMAPAVHATDCVVTNTADSALGMPPVVDSLRDCMERARSGDTIIFDSTVFDLTNADAATVIRVNGALPSLDDGNVTIDAANRRVTINGSGAGTSSGITLSSSGNVVRGLTIVGFARSGVQITDGTSNVLGGDRSVGGGPNGQGLRISSSGSFGVEIGGSTTTGNTVKGCWIGLDASGDAAEANLAGVLIQGGSSGNAIGSVAPGEANVISGNTGAGVTITGAGTDSNVVIGNTVGASAAVLSSRRELPNGGPGISITDGAQLTQIGGTNSSEGNVIAYNGGTGVEVRSVSSRRNSIRGNSIFRNSHGGIALFDGSNDGITSPKIQRIVEAPPNGAGPQLSVEGTMATDGTVEIFNDSGDQGETFVRRGSYTSGHFELQIDGHASTAYLRVSGTLTDANGNTSPFGIFGLTGDEDTDGDGFSDEIEAIAGTNPVDRGSAPALVGPLSLTKLSVKLNFAKSGADAIGLKGTVTLPTGFPLAGARIGVWVSRHGNTLVLDDKGKATSSDGLESITLKTSPKTGVTAVQYKVKKSALQGEVGPLGLDNRTTPKAGAALITPFVLTTSSSVGASVYHGNAPLTYKAKQGKSGKASLSK